MASSGGQEDSPKTPQAQVEECVDALDFIPGKQMMPNTQKLKNMGQSFTSVLGQLTSLSGRGSAILTSPTTPLSPQSEQMIRDAANNEDEEEEFKSLLHKKLYERNQALHRSLQSKVSENYTQIPEKMLELRRSFAGTEETLQESVMALQKSNHHCGEVFWSMDDSINIANSLQFPNF